jgi:hypothetical protein
MPEAPPSSPCPRQLTADAAEPGTLGHSLTTADSHTFSPQLSPTWQSVRSQDSGFSDSSEDSARSPVTTVGEACHCISPNNAVAGSLLGCGGGAGVACQQMLPSCRCCHWKQREPTTSATQQDPSVDSYVTTCHSKDILRSTNDVIQYLNDDAVTSRKEGQTKAREPGQEVLLQLPAALLLTPHRRTGPLSSTPVRASLGQRFLAGTTVSGDTTVIHPSSCAGTTTRLKDVKRRRRRRSSSQHRGSYIASTIKPFSGLTLCRNNVVSRSLATLPAAGGLSQSMIDDEEWGEPREFLAGLMMMDASLAQQQAPEVNLRVAEGRARLGPVYDWWRELLHRAEAECLTYLQSKPVGQPPAGPAERMGQSALISMEPAVTSQGPFVQSSMLKMEPVVRSVMPPMEPVVQSAMPPVEPVVQSSMLSMEPVVQSAMPPVEPVVQSSMLSMEPVVRSVMPPVEPVVRSVMPQVEPVVRSVMSQVEPVVRSVMPPVEPVVRSVMLPIEPVVRSDMPPGEPVVRSAMPLIEPVVRSVMPLMDSGRGHAMHPSEPAASRIRTLGYAAQNIQDIFNILKRWEYFSCQTSCLLFRPTCKSLLPTPFGLSPSFLISCHALLVCLLFPALQSLSLPAFRCSPLLISSVSHFLPYYFSLLTFQRSSLSAFQCLLLPAFLCLSLLASSVPHFLLAYPDALKILCQLIFCLFPCP